MYAPLRYVRLWLAFARFALLGELAFRANFLLKMFVEVLWLTILLMFYQTIFTKTPGIAGWNANEYRFFVGCYFAPFRIPHANSHSEIRSPSPRLSHCEGRAIAPRPVV